MVRHRGVVLFGWCGLAIFSAAGLSVLGQTLLAQTMLPWFGGAPDVWNVTVFYCQLFALAGCGYAWLLSRTLPISTQTVVHTLLSAGAILLLWQLPPLPDFTWQPVDWNWPEWHMLKVLVVYLGWPLAALGATLPLIHHWRQAECEGEETFRWQAWAAAAGCVAITAYLMVLEPGLLRLLQAGLWRAGFGMFALSVALVMLALRTKPTDPLIAPVTPPPKPPAAATRWADADEDERPRPMRPWQQLCLWLVLPGFAMLLSLGVTNHFAQKIPSSSFIWLTPLLFVQLAMFLSFDHVRWYSRRWSGAGLMVSVLAISSHAANPNMDNPLAEMAAYYTTLSFASLICFGELAAVRPSPNRAVVFYTAITASQAVGSGLVAIVAPRVFKGFIELSLGLLAAFIVGAATMAMDPVLFARDRGRLARGVLLVAAGATLAFVSFNFFKAHRDPWDVVESQRGFFGSVFVYKPISEDVKTEGRFLFDGGRVHGFEYLHPQRASEPGIYHGKESGAGIVIEDFRKRLPRQPLKIGVIGLSSGSLAAYAERFSDPKATAAEKPPVASDSARSSADPLASSDSDDPDSEAPDGAQVGGGTKAAEKGTGGASRTDQVVFYEVNPQVASLAVRRFRYLRSEGLTDGKTEEEEGEVPLSGVTCRGGKWRIVLGDPRLQLSRDTTQRFDILILDIQRGDVIPMHLLTHEAFQLYFGHVKDNGAILVNCETAHMDLSGLVCALARKTERFPAVLVRKVSYPPRGAVLDSVWTVVSKDESWISRLQLQSKIPQPPPLPQPVPLWTDERADLVRFLQ